VGDVEAAIQRMMASGHFETEAQLCRALGISQSSLVKAKRKGHLSERLLLKFALAYDVPVKWLLTGKRTPEDKRRRVTLTPALVGEIELTGLHELVDEIYGTAEKPLQEALRALLKELAIVLKMRHALRTKTPSRVKKPRST
jgi:transcriptional regulator with XRE-family HTH domain